MADLQQERITLCVLHPKKNFFYFQVKKFTHNKPEGWTKCEAPTDSFWAQAIRHFSCTSIAEMKGASKHLQHKKHLVDLRFSEVVECVVSNRTCFRNKWFTYSFLRKNLWLHDHHSLTGTFKKHTRTHAPTSCLNALVLATLLE